VTTESSIEQSLTAARSEHLVPGREIHLQDVRGRRFGEVALITGGGQDDAIANIWNTTGACDPAPEQFDALDADAIARENGAMRAWLNPVRHWMFDQLDVTEAGDNRTFGDITGTWIGAVSEAALTHNTLQGSYDPGYIYRNNVTSTFNRGSEVYLLDAPDGEVFIMQSFARHRDPTLREGELPHLVSRLDLPAGWAFRAEMLDQDLEVSSNIDNLAHVLQDDLANIYQGSDAGRSFSDLWPENGRW
jgi:hypothetical protein